jgi:alkyl hydroperoxide reductase subunit AhpC
VSCQEAFITTEHDQDGNTLTFNMIEDESGDVFWGYGHREADEFTAEVNRWFVYCGIVTDPDDLIQVSTPVEHLHVRWNDEYRDRFTIMENVNDAFPVTRLML